MPQVFQVLKCYKCSVFQVHQTKKSNKFSCKMCGEKQSIKRHYGVGNGQECRVHVQKLNSIRGKMLEVESLAKESAETEIEFCPSMTKEQEAVKKHGSKWVDYINGDENLHPSEPQDEKMFLEDKEVVLEIPDRKRKRITYNGFKIKSKKDDDNEINNIEYHCLNKNEFDVIQNTVSKKCLRKKLPNSKINYNLVNIINKDTVYKQKGKKPFVPPLSNQNSKWVKFEPNTQSNCLSENNLLSQESHINDVDRCSNISKIINKMKYEEDSYSKSKEQDNNKESFNRVACENSKWAVFIEESDIDKVTSQDYDSHVDSENQLDNESQVDNVSQIDSEYCSQRNLQNLFALCDDKAIDEILDI